MPKSKDPDTYNSAYYTLFEAVAERGTHRIPGLTRDDAIWLRHDLYAFRLALSSVNPDFARPFMGIKIHMRSTDGEEYILILQQASATKVGRAIEESLAGFSPATPPTMPTEAPDEADLPPDMIEENLFEEPEEDLTDLEDHTTATLKDLGLI